MKQNPNIYNTSVDYVIQDLPIHYIESIKTFEVLQESLPNFPNDPLEYLGSFKLKNRDTNKSVLFVYIRKSESALFYEAHERHFNLKVVIQLKKR